MCPAGAAVEIAFIKINIGAVFRDVLHLHASALVNEAVVAIPVEFLHGFSSIAGPTFYSVIFAIFLQAPFFALRRMTVTDIAVAGPAPLLVLATFALPDLNAFAFFANAFAYRNTHGGVCGQPDQLMATVPTGRVFDAPNIALFVAFRRCIEIFRPYAFLFLFK